ncbi:deoxyribose-phosphate aldolase [bacterium 1XD21-13]|nr:deoxyribose-phosphate aldolase [bacterium 1XD21-13]
MEDTYDFEYGKYIEHSILRPDTKRCDVESFCQDAIDYRFVAVAVTPANVKYAVEYLKDTDILVGAAIGFPLGTSTTFIKVAETIDAIHNGAREVDMVINIGALKDGLYDFVREEIRQVTEAAHPSVPVKVIIETYLLTDEEKKTACRLAVEAGADYVKTCTGFNGGKATVEDVKLMKEAVGGNCKIKASTGIKSRAIADALLAAGAVRLGTSSGIRIEAGN